MIKSCLKKTVYALLAAVLIFTLPALVSCRNDKESDEVIIAADASSDYVIVYPASAPASVSGFAEDVCTLVKDVTGAELSITDDGAAETGREILIGETNREESQTAKEMLGEGDEYVVAIVGEKMVIYASSATRYKTVLNYLANGIVKDGKLALSRDFCHTGNKVTFFAADEKVKGRTSVDITITPTNAKSEAGIFIGADYEKGLFGYRGYVLSASKNALTVYKVTSKLSEMASREINSYKADEDIALRFEVDGYTLKAYLLDDAEGVEPWPEFVLEINECEDYSIGFVELSGNGAVYRDLSISYPEKEDAVKTYYTNAIYDNYADPDVLYYDGTYYLYGTGGSGYTVHTSRDLVNWKAGRRVLTPNLWGITKNYWAPDLEYINGKFYMVVSCDEHLGIAVSDSPTGPFVATSENYLFEKTIDGHIFVDDDGKIYLYYVSWRSTYGIYGVELDKNMKPVGAEKRLITPTEDWEKKEGNVTEGPYMLKHNGIYYLTYSGSHYKSIDYAVGYATSNKPLGTFTKYELNPIMKGNTQIHGTGHHCITATPDGKEMIIIYHCHGALNGVGQRKICLDRIRFAPVDGDIDRLEVYGPTITRQKGPIQ